MSCADILNSPITAFNWVNPLSSQRQQESLDDHKDVISLCETTASFTVVYTNEQINNQIEKSR